MKLKLCYLANPTSPHTVKWANHFCARGYEVHVVSFEDAQGLDPGVVLHRLDTRWPLKLDYFTARRQVRNLLARIQPALLHAHYASGYGTLGRLARFHPYILSVWGSDIFDFPKRSSIHAWLLKRNLEAADRLCSTSRIMARELSEYTERAAVLTPFGVDCERFQMSESTGTRNQEFVIGTVKTLEKHSGIGYLLTAFHLLTQKHPRSRSRLVIVGGGPQEPCYRRLAQKLGLGSRVTFVGQVPHARIPAYLRTFSAFVVLSLAESFGVAALEASACGLPVVATKVGGLPEVVEDGGTGLIVPPENAEAAAEALSRLLLSPDLRRTMGRAGRQWVLEHYAWDKTAKVMETLYAETMSAVPRKNGR